MVGPGGWKGVRCAVASATSSERSGAGDRHRSLGVVVPVYEEEERLRDYGKALLAFIADQPPGSELVLVDDGSTDGTAAAVERLLADAPGVPARLLRRRHAGKGAAVAAGLRSLRTDVGAFCDLDLSTPLDQLELVVRAAERAPVLAIGSRDLTGSTLLRRQSRLREALGRTYNRLLQATVTPGVVDTQCGAKAARLTVWRAILPHTREHGFAWDAELIAVALARGIEVHEVPIEWRHDDRSKVRVGRDGLRMVAATPRIWARARSARSLPAPAPVAASEAAAPGVFDAGNAELLAGADRTHWWFRSKAAFVATALRRTGGARRARGWLVDAGAGSGGVTAMLGWRPDSVAVVEGNVTLAVRATIEHGLAATQGQVDRLPLATGSVEVVCLLDVIEHLADPIAALQEARRVLAPGGRLVVNVPAHGWLWSAADEVLGHHRRYDRRGLRHELDEAGFEPEVITHVFSWLVAPVWLRRRFRSARAGGGSDGDGARRAQLGLDATSPLLDRTALVLTAIERQLVGRISLPLGTSILAVARPAPGEPRPLGPSTPGAPPPAAGDGLHGGDRGDGGEHE